MFTKPFKLTFKGKLIPGFIVKINTKTKIDIDNFEIKDIKEDINPIIKDISQSLIEEINDD